MVVRVLNSNMECLSHLDCKITSRKVTLCHACRHAAHQRMEKARKRSAQARRRRAAKLRKQAAQARKQPAVVIPIEFADDWRNLKRKMGPVEARRILDDEIARKARKPIPAPSLSAASLSRFPKPIAQER